MDRKFSGKGGSRSFSKEKASTPAGSDLAGSAPDRAREKSDSAGERASDLDTRLRTISEGEEGMDAFLDSLSVSHDCQIPPDVPPCFDKLVALVDGEVGRYDHDRARGGYEDEYSPLLDAVEKLSRVVNSLIGFPSESKYSAPLSQGSAVLQSAMSFLEEEFRWLLEDSPGGGGGDQGESHGETTTTTAAAAASEKHYPSSSSFSSSSSCHPREDRQSGVEGHFREQQGQQHGQQQQPGDSVSTQQLERFATYPTEIMGRLRKTAATMISAGYGTECCQVYSIARRNALEESLRRIGVEKLSMDEVQKLTWESLEGEISTWTKACKRCVEVYFPGEKRVCEAVFPEWTGVTPGLLSNLARGLVIQLLNFAEAVAMTRRSVEKLFKFLDMYEALRDLIPVLDDLFPGDASPELKSETASARRRLGDAAVGSFSDLENSIKADAAKVPVPGGAVHPLTRYVMNYLKYACGEYKETMEQVYAEHQHSHHHHHPQGRDHVNMPHDEGGRGRGRSHPSHPHNEPPEPRRDGAGPQHLIPSPFVLQLNEVMNLLDNNLDAKSKLYKDPSLRCIFLMNNKRYIMQKIKGSAEIHALLGDTRKRAAELRHFHKTYTRETWSKVLACLKDDGLMQGKSTLNRALLKDRFKTFNTMFDDIHKTQSTWVVSDEQLQSELRVSISAVVVPAYRSFLGRFRHHLDSGRNAEKYIKFGPEELESSIEDLFDGTPASMARRRS